MAVFIKTLKMTKCVDIYTNYEQTAVNFYNEGKQQATEIIGFVQGTYQELDGRETRSAREMREIPSVTVPGNKPPTNNQFPTGALVEIHSSWDDALESIRSFKDMAKKIRNGELSVQDDQVHEQFFDYAQKTIQLSLQGLCEEIAMYMVLTNSSTRASKREWHEDLPAPFSDIGNFITNAVSLPFIVVNLPIEWINQKCREWYPAPFYPGKTVGDELRNMHKGTSVSQEVLDQFF